MKVSLTCIGDEFECETDLRHVEVTALGAHKQHQFVQRKNHQSHAATAKNDAKNDNCCDTVHDHVGPLIA